ncbi:MAG TPA: penicillin-binding protein 1C [Myxococcales bacterium]|jgi:penicillin-binding protein 1C
MRKLIHRFVPSRRRLRVAAALGLSFVAIALGFWSTVHRELSEPGPSRLILDRRGRYLGEVPGASGELGYWKPPYELPDKIVRATLETEDRRFWDHAGVRWGSLARAAWQNVKNRRVISGASTIAMQVARMQKPGPRSLWRKAREIVEALLLVRDHGHEQVLRQYLTIAPYGNNVRGASRAARLYFDKPVEDLSWLQASFLAAIPQMPAKMNPYDRNGLRRATHRARRILKSLHERGVIDAEELRQALASDLRLVPKPHRMPSALHAVIAWSERLPKDPSTGSGQAALLSTATIDLDIQRRVSRILTDNLDLLEGRGAGNSAAMVVDVETGDVLAYVGSKDYFSADERGAIDYARVKRSPGSTLKPFVYGLGLERSRMTAATELPDTPLEIPTALGRAYLPENVNHAFNGPMLLREALGNSRNIPALEVLAEVGVEPVLDLLERGGVRGISFEPGKYGLGLAVGSMPVTLEELTGLYLALARQGESIPLRRFADDPVAQTRMRLLSRESAALVTDILSDPFARRPTFQPGGPLDFDFPVAVKTGTSQGARDAWAVGFSDRLLIAVWIGNHDGRRMSRITGATGAGTPLHRIMAAINPEIAAYRSIPTAFPLPADTFSTAAVCPLSGRLAGPHCPSSKEEIFVKGSEPFERCPFHARVKLDVRTGLRAGPGCPKQYVKEAAMLDLPERYESWAAQKHLEIAPKQYSRLCPATPTEAPPSVAITEPHSGSRYLWDPDTPVSFSAIRLAARVEPADEEIVWLVDGKPVAKVGYPHSIRWSLRPGRHTVEARMVHRSEMAKPVSVVVDD